MMLTVILIEVFTSIIETVIYLNTVFQLILYLRQEYTNKKR